MTAITLWRVDIARRVHRFYKLDVQPDLFGGWCFIREWGRIGGEGQTRSVSFPTMQEAHAALGRHRREKEKGGYALQDPNLPRAIDHALTDAPQEQPSRKREMLHADAVFELTPGKGSK
jgi:predicted DNA-binding WGR domain protein